MSWFSVGVGSVFTEPTPTVLCLDFDVGILAPSWDNGSIIDVSSSLRYDDKAL